MAILCNALYSSARYRKTEHGGVALDCKYCGHLGGDCLRHLLVCDQICLALNVHCGRIRLPMQEQDALRFFCRFDQRWFDQVRKRAALAVFIVTIYQEVESHVDFR